MSSGLRICRKCMIRGESEEEYFRNLENYIARLEDDVRVGQDVYEERLKKCGQCRHLQKGMCRLCGCYVELRAALKVRRCPDTERKW